MAYDTSGPATGDAFVMIAWMAPSGRGWAGRSHLPGSCLRSRAVAAASRPCRRSFRVAHRSHPHAASPIHRQARFGADRRSDRRRPSRTVDDDVSGVEEAPLQRAGQAAALRQHLRQRRGHPLPAEGADGTRDRRHDQHHPVSGWWQPGGDGATASARAGAPSRGRGRPAATPATR